MKKILIDTSIWVEYFKGNETVVKTHDSIASGLICITGLIVTELIQGMKNEKEKNDFVMTLSSIPRLLINDKDWVDAGLVGSELRKKGITVPLPDLIIYTVALNNDCLIWTRDKHFGIIKEALSSDIEIYLMDKW